MAKQEIECRNCNVVLGLIRRAINRLHVEKTQNAYYVVGLLRGSLNVILGKDEAPEIAEEDPEK